jgi:hypothetical protein
MRHHCIKTGTTKVMGVVTNYKKWVFTSYNMMGEIDYYIKQS